MAISIGVSVGSVDKMVTEGALPAPRVWHTRKIWLISEVEAYLNEWPTEHSDAPANRNEWDEPGETQKGAVGFTLPNSPNNPQAQHYARLGFDPQTMDAADYKRLYGEAEAKWKASIPGTPLTKRETKALYQVRGLPAGTIPRSNSKWFGIDTAERLEARGFIAIKMKAQDRLDHYVLTIEGEAAANNLPKS